MRRAVTAVLLGGTVALACGGHDEVTPLIAVQPGAAARAMALAGKGGPNYPAPASPPRADDAVVPAEPAAPGSIAFSCLEERGAMKALARVPCEVTLAARGNDPPRAIVAENGKVSVAVPAGAYRVTVSRGPEYARVAWDAEVHPGKVTWGPNEGATLLRRVVDTRGYLAVDWIGAGGETRDALAADAAGGIEIVIGEVAALVEGAKLDDVLQPVDRFDLDVMDPLAGPTAFLARLASKRPATAVTSAPARTYVRVDDDGAVSTWSPAREADLVRGLRERRDVVVTTGPLLRVTANGAPIGGVARAAPNGDVDVRVHVECASWLDVARISIVRASGGAEEVQPITLRATGPGGADARSADAAFHLHAVSDDAFVVVADAGPSSAGAAVTGALWIDADGDGESLGRSSVRAVAPAKP